MKRGSSGTSAVSFEESLSPVASAFFHFSAQDMALMGGMFLGMVPLKLLSTGTQLLELHMSRESEAR